MPYRTVWHGAFGFMKYPGHLALFDIDVDISGITRISRAWYFEMAPSMSVNFISLVTSCVGLREEEPLTAHPMSFTWASHIATSMLTGC